MSGRAPPCGPRRAYEVDTRICTQGGGRTSLTTQSSSSTRLSARSLPKQWLAQTHRGVMKALSRSDDRVDRIAQSPERAILRRCDGTRRESRRPPFRCTMKRKKRPTARVAPCGGTLARRIPRCTMHVTSRRPMSPRAAPRRSSPVPPPCAALRCFSRALALCSAHAHAGPGRCGAHTTGLSKLCSAHAHAATGPEGCGVRTTAP